MEDVGLAQSIFRVNWAIWTTCAGRAAESGVVATLFTCLSACKARLLGSRHVCAPSLSCSFTQPIICYIIYLISPH